MRKNFANIALDKLATMVGLEIVDRKGTLTRMESAPHFLSAQIHLYILLYFYASSNDGVVSEISIRQLAKEIKRDVKTVRKSLRMLNENALISMPVYNDDSEVSVMILDIKEMYQRRGEGGHGYLACNTEMLNTILHANTINQLRTVISGLIICTNSEMNASAKGLNKYQIAMRDLRKSFPLSARPIDVTAAVSEQSVFATVFERITADKLHYIYVQVKDTLRTTMVKHQIRLDAQATIHAELKSIAEIIRDINTSIAEDGYVPAKGMRGLLQHGITIDDKISLVDTHHALPLLDLTSSVVNDCCTIAQDLGIDTVLAAIRHFYMEYLIPGNFKQNQKKSLGGLLRRIANDLIGTNGTTALA